MPGLAIYETPIKLINSSVFGAVDWTANRGAPHKSTSNFHWLFIILTSPTTVAGQNRAI